VVAFVMREILWVNGNWTICTKHLSGVRSLRAGVENPCEHGADGEEDHTAPEESLDGHQREQDTDDKGAECANRGGPADDATGLVLRENHGHLFKGAGVAKTCEEEHQEHCAEEPPELVWVGGVQK